jgi:hypothetical protein
MSVNYKILAQDTLLEAYEGSVFSFSAISSNLSAVSTNGIQWTQSSLPLGFWQSVAHGENAVVALGQNVPAAYSTNGLTWTLHSLPVTGNWDFVAYGDGKFVSLNSPSSSGVYSTNGTTWIEFTLPATASWRSGTYGDGKFVAVAIGSDIAAYSTNGVTWTQTTMPASQSWQSVAYGNDGFVAIAQNTSDAAYSTNGITWTQSTLPESTSWSSVAYLNGKFVAVASFSNIAAHSTNGITWVQSTLPSSDVSWGSVVYGDDKFVSRGRYSSVSAYSTDGITWTQATMSSNSSWKSASYGTVSATLYRPKPVYTVPENTQASISSISVINNDTVSHTYSVGIVKAAGSGTAGITATQTIIPTRTIEPGVVDEIVGGITLSAEDQVRTNSGSPGLTVHIYGVELS